MPLDNVADTGYIVDMTNETTTKTRPVCSYYQCRKTATHVATGGDIFCSSHAAEMLVSFAKVSWSRDWTVSPASHDDLVSLAQFRRNR